MMASLKGGRKEESSCYKFEDSFPSIGFSYSQQELNSFKKA